MNTDKIIRGIATLIIIAAVVAVVGYLWHVVLYVVAAAVLAILGRPLVRILNSVSLFGRRMSRGIAAAITLVVIWIIAGGLLALFAPLILSKAYELAYLEWDSIKEVISQALLDVEVFLESNLPIDVPNLEDMLREKFSSIFTPDMLEGVAGYALNAVIAFFSISFITFFFLREDGLFYKGVALFFPDKYHENVYRALDSITKLLSRYFAGLFVESIVLMTVISVVMMLFGMGASDALIIGLVMGVMNVVPYAGPVIGATISMLLSMLTPIDGDIMFTIVVLASTIIIVKVIDDFIIQPTLYSERVQAHPLEVFLVILAAGFIGGVWGMLLAIPMYTILRVFAREFLSEYSIVQKLTNQMTK
ncbi:MAG: AI-2E family transporter [Alistipes sp.]|nr:AI-2E family transporter [Alistipes sp.]